MKNSSETKFQSEKQKPTQLQVKVSCVPVVFSLWPEIACTIFFLTVSLFFFPKVHLWIILNLQKEWKLSTHINFPYGAKPCWMSLQNKLTVEQNGWGAAVLAVCSSCITRKTSTNNSIRCEPGLLPTAN